jgi:hypothetical protein
LPLSLIYNFSMKNLSPRFLFISSLIVLAAVSRLLPHPPNFTAIGAMALFGGAYLSKKYAFFIPLAAMLISDALIGFHSNMISVYFSIMLIVVVGLFISRNANLYRIVGGSLTASVLFFLITNFAVWLGSTYYPQNPAGLIACYVSAVPFFNYTIMGDLFFSGVLFGGFYFARQRFPQLS